MRSVWGIEHGEVSKAYRKLAPKLYRALDKMPAYEKQNMDQRLRYNTLHIRGVAGNYGRANRTKKSAEYAEFNQGWKKMADASARGVEAISRRKGRKLP